MADLMRNKEVVRFGPRRLYGSHNGKDSHYEVAGDSGKIVTRSDPENTY